MALFTAPLPNTDHWYYKQTVLGTCKNQMPALNVWWRRWFIGSDDVPFVLIFCVPIVVLWIILMPLWMAGLSNATCQASLTQHYIYGGCMIGLMCITLFSCISGIYYGSQGGCARHFGYTRCMHDHMHECTQGQCLRHTSDDLWRLAHGCFSPKPSSIPAQQVQEYWWYCAYGVHDGYQGMRTRGCVPGVEMSSTQTLPSSNHPHHTVWGTILVANWPGCTGTTFVRGYTTLLVCSIVEAKYPTKVLYSLMYIIPASSSLHDAHPPFLSTHPPGLCRDALDHCWTFLVSCGADIQRLPQLSR